MYNHNKAQQSKNRVHISWDILYVFDDVIILNQRQDFLHVLQSYQIGFMSS